MHDRLDGLIRDRSAWKGPDFANDSSWIYELSDAERAEMDVALRRISDKGLAPREFSRDEFALPTLAPRIVEFLDELENGRGFLVLRGIPVAHYDEAALYRLYWGLAVHFGDMISQNAKGDLIGRVENIGDDYNAFNARGYTTDAELHPHNDSSDIVGLLCVRKAREGGETIIASAMAIYNDIAQHHPEFLDALYAGFHYDIRGEGKGRDPNEVTRNRVPVYSYHDGRLSCRYNQRAILTAVDKVGKPLSKIEADAVEYIAARSRDPAFKLSFSMQPGDLQLLNNHMILHARTRFFDAPEPQRRRLMLRLWVNRRAGEGRELAAEFADRYNTGHRQGVAAG